jgi:hypothetical protein
LSENRALANHQKSGSRALEITKAKNVGNRGVFLFSKAAQILRNFWLLL